MTVFTDPLTAHPAVAATAAVPKPPTGEPLPEWANLAFGALALIALVLGMVWLLRRGKGGPWR